MSSVPFFWNNSHFYLIGLIQKSKYNEKKYERRKL